VGLLRLAVEKVIAAAMTEDRAQLSANLLDEALERIDSRRELTVRCAPDDQELMEELLRQAQERHPDLANWKTRPDPDIQQGGVVLDSGVGLVDNSLQTRLNSVSFVFDQLMATAHSGDEDEVQAPDHEHA
ncbi:MAG: FliH/SctL family protein, partial [Desulfovibrionaceae bacterium]